MNNKHQRSLVLTGFMGTGKTSVGRKIAQRLEVPFFDIDALIETREAQSVRAIFETQGQAYFRAREAEWCTWLARAETAVIATGGGALVDPRNRSAFGCCYIVCLDAAPLEIAARLGNARERPLLSDPSALERIERLLSERRAAYAALARHVDTTGKSIAQVAEEIIALYRAESGRP